MSKRPESAGPMVHLLIAMAVLGLVFGGGVVVGWATRERRPPATGKSAASIPDAEVKRELAACRRALKARAKATAIPPATATSPPGETDDAGVEKAAAKVEALQKEVEECIARETLANANVCGRIRDHSNLLFVLTYSASCVDEAGVGEFLVNSLKKCADFDDFPAHLDEGKLTQEEKFIISQSQQNRALRTKNDLINNVQATLRRCRKKFGLSPE
ncbi:putative secreted protein [Sorangium cellulosum So ce56]|uniref:Secreted protein n=1 Tax=Sorangium cellulosum (strain So ce56) TaxID=448385 RepID=A9GUH9_SORC5|nr:hypothetical protein [Sorangium cellulosum]CAN90623.1 putative secreted protein [Sorangium cellulosum So ce56]